MRGDRRAAIRPTRRRVDCPHDVSVVLNADLAQCQQCGELIAIDDQIAEMEQARAALFEREAN